MILDIVANAAAKALDATEKTLLNYLPDPPTAQERAPHQKVRKTPISIPVFVPAHRLNVPEREMLRQYGRWFLELQCGSLRPYTREQVRLIHAANGDIEASSTHERLWVKYQQIWLDAIARRPP